MINPLAQRAIDSILFDGDPLTRLSGLENLLVGIEFDCRSVSLMLRGLREKARLNGAMSTGDLSAALQTAERLTGEFDAVANALVEAVTVQLSRKTAESQETKTNLH